MPRLVIPDDAPPVMARSHAYQRLRTCDHQLYDSLPGTPQELAARVGDAEAVINIRASTRFGGGVFDQCRQLRLISIWGTGTDHVDLTGARERGVTVTNTPGVSRLPLPNTRCR